MSWYDVEESRLATGTDAATTFGDKAIENAKGVPFLGAGVSILQAGYHAGSAIYDGVNGDRNGAVDHGAQALWNAVGVVPGMSDMMENAEAGASVLGLGARELTNAAGGDASQVPDGLDSLAGSWAVGATNAMFGEDDSNWIADGDKPQGTRQGEIAAGVNMMLGGPLGLLAGDMDGGIGGGVAELAGDLFGSSTTPGSTSGAGDDNWAANAGIAAHDELGGFGGGMLGGAMLGAMMYGPMGALGGLGLGSAAGELVENGMPDLGGLMPDLGGGDVPGAGPGLWQDLGGLMPDLGGGVPGTGPGLWQDKLPDLGGGSVPGTGPGLWQSDTSALDPIIAGLGTPGMLLPPTAPSGGGVGAAMGATQGQFAGGGAAGGAGGGSAGTIPGAGAAGGGAAAGAGKAQPTGGDITPYLPPMFESVGDIF